MYAHLGSVDSFLTNLGTKIVHAADVVSADAQKVSGAVKGAAVGSQSSPYQPYIVPGLVAAGAVVLAVLLTRGGHRGR